MHHHNQHDKAWRAFFIVIAMLIGFLVGRIGAYAQTSSNPSAPGSNYPVDDAAVGANDATDGAGVAEAPGVPNDAATARSIDDSTAARVDSADFDSAPPATTAASDEASGSGSEDGAVLEIPQVVNPHDGSAAGEEPEGAVASREGDDEDSTTSAPAGEDTAALDSSAPTAAQVGTLQDYETQANQAPPGPIFFAPGVAVVRFPRPLFFNSPPRPLLGAPLARSPIILPPTSGGPFPSTSPMLMAPRVGIVGSFPRGGLRGFHR